jgi:predicted phage terminase large subunit-like protein
MPRWPKKLLAPTPPAQLTEQQWEDRLLAAKRLLAIREAKERFLPFIKLMMPDPNDPANPEKTAYRDTPASRLLCEWVEQVESGHLRRGATSLPPQVGKTFHLSEKGPAWIWGRQPTARICLATYNQIRANELGTTFRDQIRNPVYKAIFPDIELHDDAQSKGVMRNTAGGKIIFTGKGGSITGEGFDYFLIDDPIKGDEDEADVTPLALDRLWKWFFKVAFSRGNKRTRILVVHTRWSEDDLIGRLCDPDHPERGKRYKHDVTRWRYLNLPGVITDPILADVLKLELRTPTDPQVVEAFGTKPMCVIDPHEKSLEDYAEWKLGDDRTFSSLVLGQPAPESGAYFNVDWLVEYGRDELPKNLRIYAASDHGVSEKQVRDPSVLGCVGIDEDDVVWVLPDLVWEHMETDVTVDEILSMIRRRKPIFWWMEHELISKAFGPFLRRRMMETKTYAAVVPVIPSKDKRTRARAIQGMMALKRVRFPSFAPWWQQARAQLLRFPYATHDDFVDWLAHIGQGLDSEVAAEKPEEEQSNVVVVGSYEWIKARSKMEERQRKLAVGSL